MSDNVNEPATSEELPPMCESMIRVVDYAEALGAENLAALEGCWEIQIDPDWWIAANGHRDHRKATIIGGRPLHPAIIGVVDVPPFHVLLVHRGDPLGLINAFGGEVINKPGASEADFLEAMIKAIRRAGGTPTAGKSDEAPVDDTKG